MTAEGSRPRPSFLVGWATWIGRLDRSLKKRGFLGTVNSAATIVRGVVRSRLLWPYLHCLDKVFDWRFSVDTADTLSLPELKTDPRFKDSHGYGPTPRYRFFRMLRQLHVDYSKFVFIDFGCGKGKALLLAAGLPFKGIIGVELSSKLMGAAEENIRRYRGRRRCSTFNLACVDASEYPIPPDDAVFYFNNPFKENVLHKVLENIRRSLGEEPRDAYVVYLEPAFKSLLDESTFLVPVRQKSWYSIYKASQGQCGPIPAERANSRSDSLPVKFFQSLRHRGVGQTIKQSPTFARRAVVQGFNRFLSDPWRNYWDRVFDQRFGIDTAGLVILPELQSDPRFSHSLPYEPTQQSIFFRMLGQLDVDYRRFVFIDFGCGKGKALFLAAELPFKQIYGVELSSKLLCIAENNLKSYLTRTGKNNIFQLACMDASEYPISLEPSIYYFCNPFKEEVMRKVLENIRRSLAAARREAYVVYLTPVLRGLLDDSGFLTPIKQTSQYSLYKSSGGEVG